MIYLDDFLHLQEGRFKVWSLQCCVILYAFPGLQRDKRWELSWAWPAEGITGVGPKMFQGMRKVQSDSNTLPETIIAPKIGLPNRKVVFQPSIFRGYVSFREGNFHYFS